jgi:hypothetical protein
MKTYKNGAASSSILLPVLIKIRQSQYTISVNGWDLTRDLLNTKASNPTTRPPSRH